MGSDDDGRGDHVAVVVMFLRPYLGRSQHRDHRHTAEGIGGGGLIRRYPHRYTHQDFFCGWHLMWCQGPTAPDFRPTPTPEEVERATTAEAARAQVTPASTVPRSEQRARCRSSWRDRSGTAQSLGRMGRRRPAARQRGRPRAGRSCCTARHPRRSLRSGQRHASGWHCARRDVPGSSSADQPSSAAASLSACRAR